MKIKLKILTILLFFGGIVSAQKGIISTPSVPTTGQTIRFDGTKWDTATISGVSNAWLTTGNPATATLQFGTTAGSAFGFKFIGNGIDAGGMTAARNFSFGQLGGSHRLTLRTGGHESLQFMLSTLQDSIEMGATNANPNGTISALTGSMMFDGVAGVPYVNQSGGGTGSTWRKLQTGNDTIQTVSMQVLQPNYVGASGTDNLAYFTVPSWMNGYELIDYQVSYFSTTNTTGTTLFRLQRNATDLTGAPIANAALTAETGGFNQTLTAGDVLTLDTGADTGAPNGTYTGLSVIMRIIEK